MAQSGRDQWVLFSKHDRLVVDVLSEESPLPYGTGNPKKLREIVCSLPNLRKILDLGCNAACWSPIFHDLEYYGIDQDLEIFIQARKNKSNGYFVQGSGEHLPFKDKYFDLVFTSHVLQHNDHYPEKDVILREINRSLKVGGYYLMVESTSEAAKFTDQTFNKQGWVDFISDRGFDFLNYWSPEEYLFHKIGDPNERTPSVFPYRNTAS